MLERTQPIAHVRKVEEGFLLQSVLDHANGTALFSKAFASEFGSEVWGEWIGLAHDLGKLSPYFQQYIKVNSGIEDSSTRMAKEDHSSAGAIFAAEILPRIFPPLAYCIAGHHSGLLDWISSGEANMTQRLSKKELLARIDRQDIYLFGLIKDETIFPRPNLKNAQKGLHQWIRMLYSCLVDADYLDTEKFMNPEQSAERGKYDSLIDLKERFDQHMDNFSANTPLTQINQIRSAILQQCRQKGKETSGFYNLSLPTGGGKTLSSMAWALEHAVVHKKHRIIVAIPYTSIIAQTAAIFRGIFGIKNVIEHHSNIQEEEQIGYSNKLGTENWDAPIVVTTNVQLFESLYAAKPSKCRKLHNLSNSVLILDEAQMFPVEFLKPVLDVLQGLNTDFNTSILFTTATPPVFTGEIGSGRSVFEGLSEPVRELIPTTMDLSVFRRVEIEWPEENSILEYQDLASRLCEYEPDS